MNYPKEIKRYCPKCKKHTTQKVSIYKAGKRRASAIGERRHAEDKKGYGGQKFPKLAKPAKVTKKVTKLDQMYSQDLANPGTRYFPPRWMIVVLDPMVCAASDPTYAMRPFTTATCVSGTISPVYTETSEHPSSTRSALRLPMATSFSMFIDFESLSTHSFRRLS